MKIIVISEKKLYKILHDRLYPRHTPITVVQDAVNDIREAAEIVINEPGDLMKSFTDSD